MQRSMLEAVHGANLAQMDLMDEQTKLRPFIRKDEAQ